MGTRTEGGSRARRPVPPAVRKLFRVLDEALEEDPGMLDDPGGDMDVPDAGGDSHTHIHIHAGGGEGAAPAAPAAELPAEPGMEDGGGAPGALPGEEGMDPNAMQQEDPTEARFQAIEAALGQIMEALGMNGGGEPDGDETAPGAGGSDGSDIDDSNLPDGSGGADDGGDLDGSGEQEPTKDNAMRNKTGDSAALETGYKALVSDAEVLVPGFRMPTFDAALPRKMTVDSMCLMRRRILDNLYATVEGKTLVDGVAGGEFNVQDAECQSVATVFRAAAGAKRLLNNRDATRDAGSLPRSTTQAGAVGQVKTLAELNKLNRQFHAARDKISAGSLK